MALITVSDRRAGECLSRRQFDDQKAAWCCNALIAALMSAAWLPTFIHSSQSEIGKDRRPAGHVRSPKSSAAIGVLLLCPGPGVLGWFVHPEVAVAIFVFMVCYYAATSRGVAYWPLLIDRDPFERSHRTLETRSMTPHTSSSHTGSRRQRALRSFFAATSLTFWKPRFKRFLMHFQLGWPALAGSPTK